MPEEQWNTWAPQHKHALVRARAFVEQKNALAAEMELFRSEQQSEEEKWYAKYLALRCHLLRDDCTQALEMAALAHEMRPRRKEPLYHLARHFREHGKPRFACQLILGLMNNNPPESDTLFVEEDVYKQHTLLYEISITAYYQDAKTLGLQACDSLLTTWVHELESWRHENVLSNIVFYLPMLGAAEHQYLDCPLENHHGFNPSILLQEEGELLVNVRVSNADARFLVQDATTKRRVPATSEQPIVTSNFRGTWPQKEPWKDFRPRRLPRSCGGVILGLEDVRLFRFQGTVHFVATSQEFRPNHVNTMYLGNDERCVELAGPNEHRYEKNWLLFEHSGKLLALYSFSPFWILKVDAESGRTTTFMHEDTGLPPWRGSAGPILLGHSYLVVVHQRIDSKRVYFHRFVLLDSETLHVTHHSPPFRLRGEFGVEFVAGMQIRDQELLLSWGENDERAVLTTVPLSSVLLSLRPLE